MPVGVLINGGAVMLGGLLGCVLGKKLNQEFQEKLQMVFAVCSMAMGITTIVLMQNMPAVVLSMILGTVLGHFCRLDQGIHKAAGGMQKAVFGIMGSSRKVSPEEMETILTVIVLFCASGTGIYGSIISGMTGDHSILMAKSVLDLFTAAIFACSLGLVVSVIAVPQMALFLVLFFCAGIIYPLCSPEMIADFKACGGCIMLATGFRMVRLKLFPVAEMIPSMILIMPVSWLWMSFVLPLVS